MQGFLPADKANGNIPNCYIFAVLTKIVNQLLCFYLTKKVP